MRTLQCVALFLVTGVVSAQIAVRGESVYTMAGAVLKNAVVVVTDGKIAAVGPDVRVPDGYRVLQAKVVTPGLIDAHSVVGLAGYLNQDDDQDQLERSAAIQPELRAIDAYNSREKLVDWVRGFGVTTLHTGHGPGTLISGQTMIVKTAGKNMDDALVRPFAMLACTIGNGAKGSDGKKPGNRSKAIAMLRSALVEASIYAEKLQAPADKLPDRNLKHEALAQVLAGKVPLMVTAHRSQDILVALRLAEEFSFPLVLDGASEAYMVSERIKQFGAKVIAHPPMMRSRGDAENATFELGAKLRKAGIPFAYQSGFESYVPKTRVVLWEAAIGAAHGLGMENALAAITIDAAKLLGIDDRVGSLEVGKDGDLALYDGDPFEYLSHCVGVVIEGELVSEGPR